MGKTVSILTLAILVCGCKSDPSDSPPPRATRHVVQGTVTASTGSLSGVQVQARAVDLNNVVGPVGACDGPTWSQETAAVDAQGKFVIVMTANPSEINTCIRVQALRAGAVLTTHTILTAMFRRVSPNVDTSKVTLTISD
jgi:hypothetical protein